jgi:hypothetical protein
VTRDWRRALRELRGGNLRLSDLHRSKLAVGAYGGARRAFDRVGLQVVVKSFYSPIPDLRSLPPGVWERRSELSGIDFDLDGQLAFVEQELAPFVDEFHTAATRFPFDNDSYGPFDAETLYAVVRWAKPERIVELGSGYTTLALGRAAAANTRDGRPPQLRVFDPYPGVAGPETPGVTELTSTAAQDVPLNVFAQLGKGDLLVVDTTHTVKVGGDVNRIVLDVLPRLAPGVYVHFHDIFLPWEYPRVWAERFGLYWAEQYLLQAFLADNARFRVVCALYALSRAHPDALRRIYPSWSTGAAPAAFWIHSQG